MYSCFPRGSNRGYALRHRRRVAVATAPLELGHAEREISAAELRARLGAQGLAVVDVRPLPLFNGWRGPGEARGGHIPGAVALPAEWLSRLSDADLQSFLADKGIAGSDEIVVYGDGDDISLFRDRLAEHVAAPVRSLTDGWP